MDDKINKRIAEAIENRKYVIAKFLLEKIITEDTVQVNSHDEELYKDYALCCFNLHQFRKTKYIVQKYLKTSKNYEGMLDDIETRKQQVLEKHYPKIWYVSTDRFRSIIEDQLMVFTEITDTISCIIADKSNLYRLILEEHGSFYNEQLNEDDIGVGVITDIIKGKSLITIPESYANDSGITDDMWYGVIGHELGHIMLRHHIGEVLIFFNYRTTPIQWEYLVNIIQESLPMGANEVLENELLADAIAVFKGYPSEVMKGREYFKSFSKGYNPIPFPFQDIERLLGWTVQDTEI